jgi:hypothetical protein
MCLYISVCRIIVRKEGRNKGKDQKPRVVSG